MHASDNSEDAFACQTLRFYEENAQTYAEQTRAIELAHLYQPFFKYIPKGGKILDVGCGAGRDLKRFINEGYEAVGIDPSETLAAMASEYSGCKVLVSSVQNTNFSQEFDGVWACASLIHLPRHELPVALGKISLALRSHGVLLVSMQIGSGEMVMDDGRFVARYTSKEVSDAIKQAGFELIDLWDTPDSLPSRHSLLWVNAIARKQLGA